MEKRVLPSIAVERVFLEYLIDTTAVSGGVRMPDMDNVIARLAAIDRSVVLHQIIATSQYRMPMSTDTMQATGVLLAALVKAGVVDRAQVNAAVTELLEDRKEFDFDTIHHEQLLKHVTGLLHPLYCGGVLTDDVIAYVTAQPHLQHLRSALESAS